MATYVIFIYYINNKGKALQIGRKKIVIETFRKGQPILILIRAVARWGLRGL